MSYQILTGDCRQHMQEQIPAGSVHCVVTSPPYWGLRDYGVAGSAWADGWQGVFGNEPTIEQYLAHTIEVFEGIRRVLREDGVVFWNIGDTYATKPPGCKGVSKSSGLNGAGKAGSYRDGLEKGHGTKMDTISARPSGNKLLIPHRVAIALQDAGWIVRQDIVWHKRSPMPESLNGIRWVRCRQKSAERFPASQGGLAAWDMGEHTHGPSGSYRDQEKTIPVYVDCPGCRKCSATGGYILRRGSWRPTTGHEYIFMLTKNAHYFCDAQAVAEPAVGDAPGNKTHKGKSAYEAGDVRHRTKAGLTNIGSREQRNPRSVWTLSSEGYKGAHFATFPTALVHKCLQAAVSLVGACDQCGSQYAPIVESERIPTRPGTDSKANSVAGEVCGNRDPQRHVAVTRVSGHRQTCACEESRRVQPTVYDPFGGSGTTVQVAHWMGLHGICSEIGGHYHDLIRERIESQPRCLRNGKSTKKRSKKNGGRCSQQVLF